MARRGLGWLVGLILLCACASGSDEHVLIATLTNNSLGPIDLVLVSFPKSLDDRVYSYPWTIKPNKPGRGEQQTLTVPLKNGMIDQATISAFRDGRTMTAPLVVSWTVEAIARQTWDLTPSRERRNGTACTKSDACGSGLCIDGTCCDTVCDGICAKCEPLSGECRRVVTGPDPGTCEAPKTCGSAGCVTPGASPPGCTNDFQCNSRVCIGGRCL